MLRPVVRHTNSAEIYAQVSGELRAFIHPASCAMGAYLEESVVATRAQDLVELELCNTTECRFPLAIFGLLNRISRSITPS